MRLQPKLGEGIFTVPEAAFILNLPANKVSRWIKKYWEIDFLAAGIYDLDSYTWGASRDRAFNFLTLIELIAVSSFRDLGLSFKKIKLARDLLSKLSNSTFPFATPRLLSDGKSIFLDEDSSKILGLDQKLQYSFKEIVSPYCKKLEFDSDTCLASRYWPLGKDHAIVVDPHHSFGQPTILGTNITVQSVYKLIQSGETKDFISNVFEIDRSQVADVILFSKRNAA